MSDKRKTEMSHSDQEIEFLLDNRMGRLFLWRLIHEGCHTFSLAFPTNAENYLMCGKRQIGMMYWNLCREIDFDKAQLAEREYFALLEEQKEQKEKENGNFNNEHGLPLG